MNNHKSDRWLNRNIAGMGLASLFSDWNHEMGFRGISVTVTE